MGEKILATSKNKLICPFWAYQSDCVENNQSNTPYICELALEWLTVIPHNKRMKLWSQLSLLDPASGGDLYTDVLVQEFHTVLIKEESGLKLCLFGNVL